MLSLSLSLSFVQDYHGPACFHVSHSGSALNEEVLGGSELDLVNILTQTTALCKTGVFGLLGKAAASRDVSGDLVRDVGVKLHRGECLKSTK